MASSPPKTLKGYTAPMARERSLCHRVIVSLHKHPKSLDSWPDGWAPILKYFDVKRYHLELWNTCRLLSHQFLVSLQNGHAASLFPFATSWDLNGSHFVQFLFFLHRKNAILKPLWSAYVKQKINWSSHAEHMGIFWPSLAEGFVSC